MLANQPVEIQTEAKEQLSSAAELGMCFVRVMSVLLISWFLGAKIYVPA